MFPIFEASGNITLKNVLDYAKTGVNINDAFKMLALQIIKKFIVMEDV